MKKDVRIEGTPFTRRRRVFDSFENPGEARRGIEAWARRLSDPWEQQRPLINRIRADLQSEIDAHPEGYEFRARVDAGWYLQELDIHARIVDAHIAKGSASWAAQHGALFGELWSELQLKIAREDIFLVGKKITDARTRTRDEINDRRHMRAAGEWARWNVAARDIWRRHPDWKVLPVARQVKKDLGLSESVDTIRRRLKKSEQAG